jgi:hypothetical protein
MRLAYLILVVGLSLPTFVSANKICIDCPSMFNIPLKYLRGCIVTYPDFWRVGE